MTIMFDLSPGAVVAIMIELLPQPAILATPDRERAAATGSAIHHKTKRGTLTALPNPTKVPLATRRLGPPAPPPNLREAAEIVPGDVGGTQLLHEAAVSEQPRAPLATLRGELRRH